MEFYSKTDIGKSRKTNQDAVKIQQYENLVWSVVCDGMGGANGGDVASKSAVNTVNTCFNINENSDNDEIKAKMYEALNLANDLIFQQAQADEKLNHMGTTIVLCVVRENLLQILYVGDSRVYLIRKNQIRQLTKDHSIVQEMVDKGEITVQDAKNHPQKNIITRALGVSAKLKPDYVYEDVQKEDVILSCSDGLTNHLSEKDILKICNNNDLSVVASKLIRIANEKGGSDNITVSLIKI